MSFPVPVGGTWHAPVTHHSVAIANAEVIPISWQPRVATHGLQQPAMIAPLQLAPQRQQQPMLGQSSSGLLQPPDISRDVRAAVESFALTPSDMAEIAARINRDPGNGGSSTHQGDPLSLGQQWVLTGADGSSSAKKKSAAKVSSRKSSRWACC
eukprot:TRINITY_DN75997_c0_g1_i1.p1 TRINITY_DN75997_c0_g1~~TRINITY_DN75997_c0_g1_i1.p1  ORF type:complete len:154 (-),score=26.04 TRINITY_DN75997_c0_g1_i1:35-496(-)